MRLKRHDPIDEAVARAFHRTADQSTPEPPVSLSRHQIARKMVERALGIEPRDPRVIAIAETIYGFDQEALERQWCRVPEHQRITYFDIAEAVLEKLA